MKSRETQEMFNFISRNPEESLVALAARLVEAGYRKFEIIDEPTAPADGGPAFGELKQVGDRAIKQGGLTIRDYFAIHANADEVTRLQRCCVENLEDFQARYRYADEMLKERAK